MTLREAGRRLKRNPHWIKGACEALGIKLVPDRTALVMSEKDFQRLAKHDARLKAAVPA